MDKGAPPGIEALRNHARFAMVLAKLMELQSGEAARQAKKRSNKKTRKAAGDVMIVQDAVKHLGLAWLFSSAQPTKKARAKSSRRTQASTVLESEKSPFPAPQWDAWFTLHRQQLPAPNEQYGSPFNSVYECRSFYGLDAPNNLAERFRNISKGEQAVHEWKCDRRIRAWGEYAGGLVTANGGWDGFAGKARLQDVTDYWPPGSIQQPATHGCDFQSFIQRVLHLERDRYIQLLVSPVGLLWPLWLIKRHDHWEWLKDLKAVYQVKQDVNALFRVIKPYNSDSDGRPNIYVDVNTHRDQTKGLPYPFNFAFEAVREASGSHVDDEPWTPSLLVPVGNRIRQEKWSPPVLFALRGDQWPRRTEPLAPNPEQRKKRKQGNAIAFTETTIGPAPNYPVSIMTIAEPCDKFATIYLHGKSDTPNTSIRNKRKNGDREAIRIHYEIKSWADAAVKNSSLNDPRNEKVELQRHEMLQGFEQGPVPDLVLTHYPADLLLRMNSAFERVLPLSLVPDVLANEEDVRELSYVLPSCVLIGGITLSSQPKMLPLIRDLGRLLWTLEGIFRRLTPSPDIIEPLFRKIDTGNVKAKREAAQEVARLCAASSGVSGSTSPHSFSVERILKKMAEDMAYALEINLDADNSGFREQFEQWGWALLLEYVRNTTVSFSAEFLLGVD